MVELSGSLEGRRALVTGAGRGLGRAVAEAFAAEGADLALLARSRDELAESALGVRAHGRVALPLVADVADAEAVAGAVETAIERLGGIDVLVNNAAVLGPVGPLVSVSAADWARAVEVNLLGAVHCIQAVLPGMLERRRGKIVNVSGGGAAAPRPRFSAYAAAKAGLVRLSETLAEEVRDAGVQVNAVAPGLLPTRMAREIVEAGEAAGDETERARAAGEDGSRPLERAVSLVVFLASDASGSLSGKLLSAANDPWQQWVGGADWLTASPLYTLRRLDPFTLAPLLGERRC